MIQKQIYSYNYSIPKETCNDIIEIFENFKEEQEDGKTVSGVRKNIKDTKEIQVDIEKTNTVWTQIVFLLRKELEIHFNKYMNKLNIKRTFDHLSIEGSNFRFQKYEKNEGKYNFHDDFVLGKNNDFRSITFIWYLNTVSEGGETEFFKENGLCIKPEAGKLILFPSFWNFPHRGKVPISSHKYIIVGWLTNINSKHI